MKKNIYKVAALGAVVLACLTARQQAFNGPTPPPPTITLLCVTVPGTQAYTARPTSGTVDNVDNRWPTTSPHGTQRGDLDFQLMTSTPSDLTVAGPAVDFDPPSPLILLKNSNVLMNVTAQSSNGSAVKFKVHRDKADHATRVGTGTFTLTPAAGGNTATMKADKRGSFYLIGYIDSNSNGDYDAGEPSAALPIIIVEVYLQQETTQVSPNDVKYVSNAGLGWSYSRLQCGGGWQTPPTVNAIKLEARALFTGGGAYGKRGVDRVYGGWTQQVKNATVAQGTYTNGTTIVTMPLKFVSNRTGQPKIAAWYTFMGGGTVPSVLVPPFLDSGRNAVARNGVVGTGSNTATLSTSKISSTASQPPTGKTVDLAAEDNPGIPFLAAHPSPAYPSYFLKELFVNIEFVTYLTFWTSTDAHTENPTTREIPAGPSTPNLTGERTYYDSYKYEWHVGATIPIDIADGSQKSTGGIAPFCAITATHEYSPISAADGLLREHETRPPVALGPDSAPGTITADAN